MRAVGLVIVFLLCFGGQQVADAQFVVGAHAGYNLDVRTTSGETGAMAVGGQVQYLIEPLPIVFNPSVDLFLTGGDEFSALQVDVNALVPFLLQAEWVTPYIGGGLAITRFSTDGTFFSGPPDGEEQTPALLEDSTDYGVNILAGVLLGVGSVRPFAVLRGTLGRHAIFSDSAGNSGEGMSLSAGILVRLSE